MNFNRDNSDFTANAFANLIDSSAAAAAAERIYQTHDGLRYCADNRTCLTAAQARAVDARDGRAFEPTRYVEPMHGDTDLARYESDNMSTAAFEEFDDENDNSDDDHLIDLGDEADYDITDEVMIDFDDPALFDEPAEMAY